jgi:hypothetical protein
MHNLDHHVLADAENTNSRCTKKGDLLRVFPLNTPMVPSSVITVTANGERLTCGGFPLGKTIRLESFEFIIDNFSILILSPRRGDSGVTFMGSTRSGTPPPWRAMIEDFAKKFLMVSSMEGALVSPLPAGAARGLYLLPSQPHNGQRMLCPLKP